MPGAELIRISRGKVAKDKGLARPRSRGSPSPCATGSTPGSRKFDGVEAEEELAATIDRVIARVAG